MPAKVPGKTQVAVGVSSILKPRNIATMFRKGLPKDTRDQLVKNAVGFRAAVRNKSTKFSDVRVDARNILSSRKGAEQKNFVGVGLDEHIQTRLLKEPSKHFSSKLATDDQLDSLFMARSRTAELVWKVNDPKGPLIAGHTPSIKSQLVSGTTGAMTSEHGTRDKTRETATSTSLNDPKSPSQIVDATIMGTLATIKYMSSPAAELNSVKSGMLAQKSSVFPAITGRDIANNNAANFDDFVNHIQEERERKKWEVGASMLTDHRLKVLVPPTMTSYLSTHKNSPTKAREAFRYDVHESLLPAPSINRSPVSDTEDLTKRSLHSMAISLARPRALSDPREPPRLIPKNARGDEI